MTRAAPLHSRRPRWREQSMRSLVPLTLLSALLLTAAAPAPPADTGSEAIEQLLANVRYWEERGRADKAAEVWQKILRSDPDNPDALAALALHAARAGATAEARGYLARLERDHRGHPKIASVRQALGLGAQYGELLAEARRLVREGRVTEAVASYRRLLGGEAPTGAIAVEFYQTLGGLPDGWDEAREGLERLASQSPGDPRLELAAARHLTYREATRREGIARLARLADAGEATATPAWRQALLWLNATTRDAPMFRAYLGAHAGDAEVKRRLASLEAVARPRPTDVHGERVQGGFDALEAQDLAKAEAAFKRVLAARRTDVDALVGLASVALQRERFDEARELLLRVKKIAPRRRELWERSLESAEFWGHVARAKKAAADTRYDEAEAALAEAIKRSPATANEARLVLGGVLVAQDELVEAEQVYHDVLAKEPDSVGALRALVELYLQMEEGERAQETNARLAAVDPEAAADPDWIGSEIARHQATARRKSGDLTGARALLDAAHLRAPDNRRVAFDLAYLQLELGDVAAARAVTDTLREGAPDGDVDTARLVTWVLAGEERFSDALEVIRGLPTAALDEPLRRLARKLEVQAETLIAVRQGTRGKALAARHRLGELHRRFADDPELVALVAIAWADLQLYDQALALMYEALSAAPRESPTLRLQLAAILHRANREAELLAVLRELSSEPNLTASERRGLVDLQIAYTVRRADQARERGAHSRAFNLLGIPLREHPDDARLLSALGRLFVSAGDYAEADRVFARVLEQDPDAVEAREGAIRAAVETGDRPRARRLRDEGLARAPESPRMHLVAARMAVLVGEDGEAMEHYERALALEVGNTALADADGASAGVSGMRQLLADAEDRFGARRSGARDAKPDVTLQEQIAREMDELKARHTVRVSAGFSTRYREGEAGLGRLFEIATPVTLSIPTGYKGRLTFGATPVLLDASELNLGLPRPAALFGTTGVDPELASGRFDQTATGILLDATFEYRTWTLKAGSSPLGFAQQTAVGELTWRDRFGDVGLSLELFRRPVTESLLAYAGATDVLTGVGWGGVTRNGGRFDLGVIDGDVRYFLFAGGALYLGEGVATNLAAQGGLGVNWRLYDWDGTSVVTGLGVSGMFFQDNLRHFTFGHGGYFSPQRFINAGVPIRWRAEGDRLSYGLSADVGVNWFQEEAAPFYPTDPGRQALRAELLDPDTEEPLGAFHSGQTSFALALNLQGHISYKLTSSFELGLRADYYSGHDFAELTGFVWAGYTFDKKVRPVDQSLEPFGGF